MRRRWYFFGVLLLLVLGLLSACSGSTETAPEQTIEMSLSSPGLESLQSTSLTTTTSALQVIGLINPPGVKVTYSINGGEAKPVNIVDGAFTFLATLVPGKNKIAVTASLIFNPKISVTKTFEVIYEPTVPGGLAYDGELKAGDPTFTRPDDGTGLTDGERTNPYHTYTFNIDRKDWYAVVSTQLFDGYLLLYKGSFDPTKPTANLIAQNDDFPSAYNSTTQTGGSRIRAELEPGKYVVVTTACGDPAAGCGPNLGAFSNLISKTDPPPPPFQLPAPDNTRFNITVRFLTNNVTAEQQAVFVDAANRWAEIITGDLGNIVLPQPVEINPTAAAIKGTIDDILIDAAFIDIDGPGQVLGRAGPRLIRTQGNNAPLTVYGVMEFDVAEFAPGGFFDDPKGYADVILHEMGHVLGIGTLWRLTNNVAGFDPNAPTDLPIGIPNPAYDPRFTGAKANAEYKVLLTKANKTDKAGVPIENTGGPGSINGHWRELTFENELMSPSASGSELLSKMTAASLGDIGYTVNLNSEAIDANYALSLTPSFVQLAPTPTTYKNLVDFIKLSAGVGTAEGTVQAVDLFIDTTADPTDPTSRHPANSTSGCETADFAGFTAGNIALVQRGTCPTSQKVENAANAGAVGVIMFNQGNTPARTGLFGGGSPGLPGVTISFDLGVELAGITGLRVRIENPRAGDPAILALAATKPTFTEEILLPIGTISPNGKLGSLPQ